MIEGHYPNSRVLIVDDEVANVTLLAKMLRRAGYENLSTTTESSKAIQLVQSFEPDLILLDLHMPPPDGFEIMDQLRFRSSADDFVPVLVLTADATELTKLRALGDGATDFLAKPFAYPELLLRLQNLLTIRHQHEELRRANVSMSATIDEHRRQAVAQQERARVITRRTELVLEGSGPRMVFQPILHLASGRIVGGEALARFSDDPEAGPEKWFREAHQVQLGIQLEIGALAAALRSLDSIPDGCFMSLNVSPKTLRSPALRHVLEAVPGDRIVLEITEHERIVDYRGIVASIADLRERGIRVAVDDTGSGFASLQHILEIRPEIVKLDRALMQRIDDSPVRRSLAAALSHFSEEIEMTIIAEGIETAEELETVQELGIAWGQGFMLGRPSDLPLSSLYQSRST